MYNSIRVPVPLQEHTLSLSTRLQCIYLLLSVLPIHLFPNIHISRHLIEVVSYICNIVILFSKILHSILNVKMYFLYTHILIHFLCCKVLWLLTNMWCIVQQFHTPKKSSMPLEVNDITLQYSYLGFPWTRSLEAIYDGVAMSQTVLRTEHNHFLEHYIPHKPFKWLLISVPLFNIFLSQLALIHSCICLHVCPAHHSVYI